VKLFIFLLGVKLKKKVFKKTGKACNLSLWVWYWKKWHLLSLWNAGKV
jgi:hypothetical protein